jgi:MacB-like periplasmic core domain
MVNPWGWLLLFIGGRPRHSRTERIAARRRQGLIFKQITETHSGRAIAGFQLDVQESATMRDILRDLKYALRQLRRSLGFTGVVVVTLALGIGANSAIFSVVNGVLLNPLPFPQPDQLVALHENKPGFEGGSVSCPNFRDWQKENRTFSAMAVARPNAFSLTGAGEAEQINSQYVSSDFFSLLGVKPLLGRTFAPGEDQVGAAPLALVSEGFWKRKLGAEPDVLGKSLTLDGSPYTIVGVIPASFHLTIPSFTESEVYVPIGQ